MTGAHAAGIGVLLCVALAAGAGCVERRMHLTSDPSGARVYLNDRDVGVTPCEVDFTWFGVYDVRLTKPGYEPLITTREAEAPLHEVPPFDLAALLLPGTKRTHIEWHFELEPVHDDPGALLERARELRERTKAERDEAEAAEENAGEEEPDADT